MTEIEVSGIKEQLRLFKLKEKIIDGLIENIQSCFPDYDYWDLSSTKEFYLFYRIVSIIVDNLASGKIEKVDLEEGCPRCCGDRHERN